jgi:sorbitol/mannitol transport system permease protein
MARAVSTGRKTFNTLLAWGVALLIAFPILWTILTSFKPEAQAVAFPPRWFDFDWTLRNYQDVQRQRDYLDYFWNSVIIALGSTVLGLLIAIPAAWSMAFVPGRRTKDLLMWMLSTKMMPGVAVLVPIYLIFSWLGRNVSETVGLDSHFALLVVLTLINLPIIVWMLYTYFREIPTEILEAARMDGATLWGEIAYVLTPMAIPGIASTFLLNVILAWNEAFWTIVLTTTDAAPLTKFISGFSSPQGLFYAKLSAASVMAIAPILVMGWFSQRQLVRGLTFGAVK